MKGEGSGIRLHSSKVKDFKKRVREITKHNRGIGFEIIMSELNRYTRGWFYYNGLTTSGSEGI